MVSGNLIFFGTSETALPFLQELHRCYPLSLVITQPDSIGGRHRQFLQSPVKQYALEHHLELLQPERLQDALLLDKIRRIEPLIGIVVSYGKWIPATVYTLPRWKTVNVHFSLLPRYRGAAPVQRALEQGNTRTGISIFEIANRMDAGDIWAQREVTIDTAETAQSLHQRLSLIGARFLMETLKNILSGKLHKQPQDESQATLAPALRKEEGKIDWQRPAVEIHNRFRAHFPWPGSTFPLSGKTIKVTQMTVSPSTQGLEPGAVLSLDLQSLKVSCGEHSILEILEIQPPGKKPMRPHDFSLGNRFPTILH